MLPDRVSYPGPLTCESGALLSVLRGLASTSCTYFRLYLTTAPLESAEGETKVCGQTRYRTQDL